MIIAKSPFVLIIIYCIIEKNDFLLIENVFLFEKKLINIIKISQNTYFCKQFIQAFHKFIKYTIYHEIYQIQIKFRHT